MTAKRIIQQIFQQPELDRVSIVTLEGVVDEYPYFTAARLLLAQKNYEQYPNLHSPAVKKAQLYTNNPHHFFQFLTGELERSGGSTDTHHYHTAAAYTPSPLAAQPIVPPAAAEKQPVALNWESITRRDAEDELDFMIREREEIRAAIKRMEALQKEEEELQARQAAPAAAPAEDNIAEQPQHIMEPAIDNAPEAPAASPAEEALEEPITYADPSTADAPFADDTSAADDTPAVEDSWEFTTGSTQPEEPEFPANEAVAAETEISQDAAVEQSAAPEAAETAAAEPAAPAAGVPVNQPTAAAAEEPIKIYPLEIPDEEDALTFQPLYTDDYFAYKRLQEPDNAEELTEKGMAEMRSFTDWLREMKQSFAKRADKDWYHQQLHRIYVDDDPEVSEAVEKMAMESITLNDDIVSETLAEIWARQRQYQTAIQIYQKLSLLNPNKSAYFAQKIQELQLAQSEADKS
ncbi:hypothetical protein [uncultured Chitinophaga sp.]|jgi:hypothetical protein|uniref:hypothetical protein n=1 Tax=uncultured Chitinophaga sp. TaxID=339340 RepID=UPI00262D408E|nr:hypothetical protein [uncultured Chitinophaga sp.]